MLRLSRTIHPDLRHDMLDLVQLTDMAKIERRSARMSEWIFQTGGPLFTAVLGDTERACRSLQTFTCRRGWEFSALSATHGYLDSAEFGVGMDWMLLER
jgi:hypothetical protein